MKLSLMLFISTISILLVSTLSLMSMGYCTGPSSNWKNCYGIKTFSDGDKYIGEFKTSGLAFGRYQWKSGSYYLGENKKGKRNGKGTLFYHDGRIKLGYFKDGKLNGYGRQIKANGLSREGIFEQDKFLRKDENSALELEKVTSIKVKDDFIEIMNISLLEKAKSGSSGDKDSLRYAMLRCAGLLYSSGIAMDKLMQDKKNSDLLKKLSTDLVSFLTKAQIKFNDKEFNQKNFDAGYLKNFSEMDYFLKRYTWRLQTNFTTSLSLIKKDPFMQNEINICLGIHDQLYR